MTQLTKKMDSSKVAADVELVPPGGGTRALLIRKVRTTFVETPLLVI